MSFMRTVIVTFLLTCIFCSFFYAKEYTNQLLGETSPYLQQHAHNPVNWYSWKPEVLQRAMREDKPLFVSIGYSTCHWCHVMEKEIFNDREVANFLNRYFICIKVDREELPQVDAYFQSIYYKNNGRRGGWPLNVFMTAQKEPFYISAYIPAQSSKEHLGFKELTEKLQKLYSDKAALYDAIEKLKKGKRQNRGSKSGVSFETLVQSLQSSYNDETKGFGNGSKFPLAKKSALLFELGYFTKNEQLQKAYFDTLDAMAMRGLYDHVDGGFFRYAVDEEWEIPHFEKMLYNQAELSELYTRAYLLSSKELYKDVVDETLAMVKRRFRTKEGLFYSASDAQSEGIEGKYYTFSQKEIQELLAGKSYETQILDALSFRTFGNFHNRIHIGFDGKNRPRFYKKFQTQLQKIRTFRSYPFIDKKINTAWNAMMIKALFKASAIDIRYKKDAQSSLDTLIKHMYREGELYHQTLLPNLPKQKALLEDYAFLIAALLAGYETDYEKKKLLFARYLTLEAKRLFCKKGVWYLSRAQEVPAKTSDKYYTSPASQMIQNIIYIAALEESLEDEKFAKVSMQSYMDTLQMELSNAPALAEAFLMLHSGVVVLKSSSKNLLDKRSKIVKTRYPYLLTKAQANSSYLACTLRLCFAKEDDIDAVISKIESYKDNF